MSAKIMGRAWDLDLPHNQLLVLLALADHADHDGNNVYPSLGLVAWKTGYSEQQVRRVIRELVKLNILVVVEKHPGRTIKYKVAIDAGVMKAPYTPTRMIPLPKCNPLHPDTSNPLHFDTPTPDMLSAKIVAEPSLEPSIEPRESAIALHPLIKVWAEVRRIDTINIGAPVYTAKDLALAKRMAKWDVPPTADEIRAVIKDSKAEKYRFDWLETDIPKMRLAQPKPKKIYTDPAMDLSKPTEIQPILKPQPETTS